VFRASFYVVSTREKLLSRLIFFHSNLKRRNIFFALNGEFNQSNGLQGLNFAGNYES